VSVSSIAKRVGLYRSGSHDEKAASPNAPGGKVVYSRAGNERERGRTRRDPATTDLPIRAWDDFFDERGRV